LMVAVLGEGEGRGKAWPCPVDNGRGGPCEEA
jgi:hypothetical protein